MNNNSPIHNLAIFGGTPSFTKELYVGYPNVGDRGRLQQYINDIFDRRWLTNNGPYVQQLEREVASIHGVKHCIAVCNATIGLEIAAQALGLRGEVILPSFTFIASAHSLKWLGITPIFCDIDEATHNIDPELVEELITPRTTGIMGVHLWGRACSIEALEAIARRRGLKLLFDAAHAFGCSYRGRMIGDFGDTEVLSFHATKFFNTLEGGAILTNDDELAEKIRFMRNFGFESHDDSIYIGTNGKMNEVSAAMGLTLLESLDEIVAINHQNYLAYHQALDAIPGVQVITYNQGEKCNYQYIIVEIDQKVTQISRDQMMAILKAEKVMARRYFYPGCHRMKAYSQDFGQNLPILPVTERVSERVFALPTGSSITPEHIDKICAIIDTAVSHGAQIKSLFEQGKFSG